MEESMRKELSTFMQGNRIATVYQTDQGFAVEMYENNMLVGDRDIIDHNEQYADDLAENWVTGVIKCLSV